MLLVWLSGFLTGVIVTLLGIAVAYTVLMKRAYFESSHGDE
jgi:hypothetical protein